MLYDFEITLVNQKKKLSVSDGLYKIASKISRRCFCEGAGHKTFHLNAYSMFLLMCSAGSDL